MRLYTIPGSRYATRCIIQIRAKGLPIEIHTLPYPIPDSFAAVNPLMLVPVLDTGTVILPESQVICDYLEDLGEGPALRPADPLDRARMQLIIRLFELHYDPHVLALYARLRDRNALDEAKIERCYAAIDKGLDLIADRLDGGAYAVGRRLTLADCALMPPFLQVQILLPAIGLPDPVSRHPRIRDYFAATRADPHVGAVLEEMEAGLRKAFVRRAS
ncbi:MAG: glutathione S-transferase family protein [Gammaproteobacteria bacterium]